MLAARYAGSPPESVCVVRLSAIGDVCHTLPVVRTLQDAWPHTRVTWILGRAEAALLEGAAGIELVVLDKSRGLAGYTDLRRRLREPSFDIVLQMHYSLRASVASRLARAPVRVGFDRSEAKDLQWLFTTHRIAPRPRMHVMDVLFGFTEALGIQERSLRWDIPIPAAARAFVDDLVEVDRPVLVISPCSSPARGRRQNFRHWSAESYARVADHAAERHGAQVFLTGASTEREREYGRRIVELASCAPLDLVGQTDLKQLLALLDRATVLVAPDSGPAHMATAVGTPVIGLYGTTNPDRAAPYLSREWVVSTYPEALREEFGLTVEEAPWGKRSHDPRAMDRIRPEAVMDKLDAVLLASR